MQHLGFRIAIYPVFCLYAVVWNMQRMLRELMHTGSISGYQDRMINFADLNGLLQLDRYLEGEARYQSS